MSLTPDSLSGGFEKANAVAASIALAFSFIGRMKLTLTIRKFQGGKEYKKFLDGKKLTRKEAMLAHCYEFMGGFDEGRQDCMCKSRPMYRLYPYNDSSRPT